MIEDFSRRYIAEDAQAPKMLGRAETEVLYRIGEAVSDINVALVESSDSDVTAALRDALKCLDDAAILIMEGY